MVKPPLVLKPTFERVYVTRKLNISILTQAAKMQIKGTGVRGRGDAVLRCFWCGFVENFIF